MRRDENRRYFKAGVTAFAVLSAVILLAFLLLRIGAIQKGINGFVRILTPFVYGVGIAYILAPMCSKIQGLLVNLLGEKRRKLSGALAILISLVLFILVIALLFIIVIPQVINSVVSIINVLPGQVMNLSNQIEEMVSVDPDLQKLWDSVTKEIISRIQAFRDTGIMPLIQQVLSGTATYVSAFVNMLSNLVLALVITVYMLATRKRFAAQARLLLRSVFNTVWADRIEQEVLYADEMFHGFFMGKLVDSAIIGVICFIGCAIMKFGSAPLIAVIVGVTNIIPFFGPFIGAIPCILILLLENPIHSLMFIVFILILQQLDGNVIGPRILGNTTGLSGFWVTFAIIVFGGFWGIVGMLVGVPLFAVIYDIVRKLTRIGLRRRGREDMITAYDAEFHAADAVKPQPVKASPEQ